MNIQFLIAGIVAALGSLLHAIGGEYFILGPMQPEQLPYNPGDDGDITKRYIRGFWHFVTVDMALAALALFALAFTNFIEPASIVARFISVHFIGFTLVVWIMALNRPVVFMRSVTQWISFLAIAILAWWGSM